MRKDKHIVDIIVDDRKITTQGKEVEVRIDGLPVYELERFDWSRVFSRKKTNPEDFEAFNTMFLLKAAKAVFGHPDRYRIATSLKDSSKSFTRIQNSLDFTPPTLDFHLKKLVSGMVVGKKKNKEYALTIIGEVILDYFSEFLQKTREIQKKLGK